MTAADWQEGDNSRMKRYMRDKKRILLSLGVSCVLMFLLMEDGLYSGDGYAAHGETVEMLPLIPGISYYEYQWGLKNTGMIQRVVSVYETGQNQDTVSLISADSGNRPSDEAGPGTSGAGFQSGQTGPAGVSDKGEEEGRVRHQVTDSVAGVDIGIEQAWSVYEGTGERRNVTVALIDTGVDMDHEELRHSIWVNEDEVPGDGIDNDHNGYVDDVNGWNFYTGSSHIFSGEEDSHGTHGAGTIAAAWDGQGTTGIADSGLVKIMVLKVLGSDDGKGVSANVKDAIRYARDNGAQICNLSMGTLTYDQEMDQLIRESPMLFVISAGNGDAEGKGYDIDALPMYPASCTADNIISVGNLLFDGSLDESSNYGAVSVDIAAPGTYILSTVPGGYGFMTGTSMAAPMVTGTAALIYSCRTDLDLTGVREAILGSARKMEGLEGKVATGGMLDAWGAITWGR